MNTIFPPLDDSIPIDSLLSFYKQNNFEIPQYIQKNQEIKNTLFYEEKEDPGIFGTTPSVLDAIKGGKDFKIPDQMVDELEDSIDRLNYKTESFPYEGGLRITKESFSSIQKVLKEQLTEHEYYTFLAAFNYSKRVPNIITIKNDGDIDLKNIKILIPSPISKVTETRDNNILSLIRVTSIFNDTDLQKDILVVQLPLLKKDKSLLLNIETRENQIDEKGITCDYRGDFKVSRKSIIFVPIVFIGLVFISNLVSWVKGRYIND